MITTHFTALEFERLGLPTDEQSTPESEPAGIGAVHPAASSQERQAVDGQFSESETRCIGFRISDETQGKPESG